MVYPDQLKIHHPTGVINGFVPLNRSKSISNRVLIIRALCSDKMEIKHLSDSDDTVALQGILENITGTEHDTHHAGTTYRFLTSYLCTQEGEQILTGSDRMKERPIGPLVEALKSIGADISYLEKEGFPPLRIGSQPSVWAEHVTLPAGISSQYISSLMLISPTLPHGLTIHLEGELVSKPYLVMTQRIMEYFGAVVEWKDNKVKIHPTGYHPADFEVEADWSAASYYYSMAAIAKEAELKIQGLRKDSLQGDRAMADIAKNFGVETDWSDGYITIRKQGKAKPFIEYDFIEQPDIAQSVFVMNGALGIHGLFTGLKTLYIKETDRIAAMQHELSKFQVYLSKVPPRFMKKDHEEKFMLDGRAAANENAQIDTYRDHRMAMAFAPLSLKFPLTINQPGVVSKSYPYFWEHLASLGFRIE